MITIDLNGPDGNAFALLAHAKSFGKQIGQGLDKIDQVQADMTSGNYEHLVQVVEREFGFVIQLVNKPAIN